VNAFHAAGGMAFVTAELIGAGLVHADIATILPDGLAAWARPARLADDGALGWADAPATASADETILAAVARPFVADGGMRLVQGNLGRAIFKTSAVARERFTVEAPAAVFASQEAVLDAFKAGALDRDVVVVVRGQGPAANGMPELHKLTPPLGVLQDRGHRVALVTDGRMSGASGKVPAAIHLTPEAHAAGPIARLRDGDPVRLCANRGGLDALVDAADWNARTPAPVAAPAPGVGRELFALFRAAVPSAEAGASPLLAASGL
jgi:phosphogluconate dehydratase